MEILDQTTRGVRPGRKNKSQWEERSEMSTTDSEKFISFVFYLDVRSWKKII